MNGADECRVAVQRAQHEQARKAALMSPLLDEVFALRALCALQSVALNDALGHSRLPQYIKGRIGRVQTRLEQGARGEAKTAISGTETARVLAFAGASETLTRTEYEKELGWPPVA